MSVHYIDFVRELLLRHPRGLRWSEVRSEVAAELARLDASRGVPPKSREEYLRRADRPTTRTLDHLKAASEVGQEREGQERDRYYRRMQFWDAYYRKVLQDVLKIADRQQRRSRSTTVPNEVLAASNHAQIRYMMIVANGRPARKASPRADVWIRQMRLKVKRFLDRHPDRWEDVLKSVLPETVSHQDSDFFLIAQSDRSAMRRTWPCPDWKKGWPVSLSISPHDRGKRLEAKLAAHYRRLREAGFPADIARRSVRDTRWSTRLSRSPEAFKKWGAGLRVPEAGPLLPPRRPPFAGVDIPGEVKFVDGVLGNRRRLSVLSPPRLRAS